MFTVMTVVEQCPNGQGYTVWAVQPACSYGSMNTSMPCCPVALRFQYLPHVIQGKVQLSSGRCGGPTPISYSPGSRCGPTWASGDVYLQHALAEGQHHTDSEGLGHRKADSTQCISGNTVGTTCLSAQGQGKLGLLCDTGLCSVCAVHIAFMFCVVEPFVGRPCAQCVCMQMYIGMGV